MLLHQWLVRQCIINKTIEMGAKTMAVSAMCCSSIGILTLSLAMLIVGVKYDNEGVVMREYRAEARSSIDQNFFRPARLVRYSV